jgi:DNA-binding PadR family transcriptional regulator
MFKELDPILHSQTRLAIVSILIGLEAAEFIYLKEKTQSSAGNLSLQLNKLQQAEYISIEKGFKGKYPVTTCKISPKGRQAFEHYVEALKEYIQLS